MLTSGIAVLCVPFATTFYAFAAIVAFYGIGLGSWMLLVSVLLSEHHGTESIGSSYGLIRLFQGMVSLIVPPLVGKSICFSLYASRITLVTMPLSKFCRVF